MATSSFITMMVTVPKGTVPGQTIAIHTPYGTTLHTKIPPGVMAGQKFSVHVPKPATPARPVLPRQVSGPTLTNKPMANTLFVEGNAFFEKKMYDAAINKYTQALKIERRDSFFGMRSQALLHKRPMDPVSALADAEEAIKLAPTDYRGYYFKAMAQEKMQRFADALATVARGLHVVPGEEHLLSIRVRVHAAMQKLASPTAPVRFVSATGLGLVEQGSRCAPFDSFFNSHRCQAIYSAQDIRAALVAGKMWRGASMSGAIDALQLKCALPGLCSHLNFRIEYCLVAAGTRFMQLNPTWLPTSQCVYGPCTLSRDSLQNDTWVSFQLTTEIRWDSNCDLVLQFSFHGRDRQCPLLGFDDRSFGLTKVVNCPLDRVLLAGDHEPAKAHPFDDNIVGRPHPGLPCLRVAFKHLAPSASSPRGVPGDISQIALEGELRWQHRPDEGPWEYYPEGTMPILTTAYKAKQVKVDLGRWFVDLSLMRQSTKGNYWAQRTIRGIDSKGRVAPPLPKPDVPPRPSVTETPSSPTSPRTSKTELEAQIKHLTDKMSYFSTQEMYLEAEQCQKEIVALTAILHQETQSNPTANPVPSAPGPPSPTPSLPIKPSDPAKQKLAIQKARESMGSLNAEEVAYLLLGLDVDPTIAYAFEQERVDGEELQVYDSPESMHATASHIRLPLFIKAFRRLKDFEGNMSAVSLKSPKESTRFDIFLSYRRSHKHLSRCIKQQLMCPRRGKDGVTRMYRVFFDMDDIGAVKDFQGELEARLRECEVVLVLMSAAPSGPANDPNGRDKMTSFETMVHYRKHNLIDWCLVEIEIALELNKLIIPMYPGSEGQAFIGAEMARISTIKTAEDICKCNALPIHDDMFSQCVDNIRENIEERFPTLGKVS